MKKPLQTIQGLSAPNHTTIIAKMKSSQFWERASLNSNEYYYYSGTLRKEAPVMQDLTPHLDWLQVPTNATKKDEFNIWFGTNGATAHCHNDASYNLYAQIYGTKKFLIFSPDVHESLYIYPALHPMIRRSQVNFSNPDLITFPTFQTLTAIEANLEPGDLLYLPPMWYHHVISGTQSISVNSWVDAIEHIINVPETTVSALPFSKFEIKTELAAKLKHYIQLLLPKLGFDTNLFIVKLLDTRYVAIQKSHPFLFDKYEELKCKAAAVPLKENTVALNLLDKVQKIFNSLSPNSVKAMYVGDYIEHISGFTLGIEYYGAFLKHCFVN